MSLLFKAIAPAKEIDRAGVKAALAHSSFTGLGAQYTFDPQGRLIDPKTYVFEYDKDRNPRLIP